MNTSPHSQGTLHRAILIIVVAIFLFDVQGALIKHMGAQYPVQQISVFRNFFGMFPNLLVLALSAQWRAKPQRFKLVRWRLAFGRGLLLVAAQMCFYSALVHMQLATATTLAFSGPLFITLLSIPLLGHRVGVWRICAVALGFAGVVMVMQPGRDAFTVYALLPIGAAFFYSLSSLLTRFFNEDESSALISIYGSIGAMISALMIVLITGHWVPLDSLTEWLWFVAMGATGGLAVFMLITAYRMCDPSSLSPFEYFGIPFSFTLGWLFFNELPFDSLFPGVFLIVGGGLLVLWRERQAKN